MRQGNEEEEEEVEEGREEEEETYMAELFFPSNQITNSCNHIHSPKYTHCCS